MFKIKINPMKKITGVLERGWNFYEDVYVTQSYNQKFCFNIKINLKKTGRLVDLKQIVIGQEMWHK